jgi:uncharacterized protein (DUF433 family)
VSQCALVGVGLYSIPDAARIIGLKPAILRRWVSEYTYTSHGVTYRHRPVVSPRRSGTKGVLTFLELIELLFVKQFRAEGVPMQVIRKAAQAAARKFDTPYPFAVRRFDTDGRSIFETLKAQPDGEAIVEDLARGQYVFDLVVRPFFRKLDYSDAGIALKFWPLDREGRVVLDPEREFGAPIDEETGVPTRALFDAVRAGGGQSSETVAAWFEVPLPAVEAAVRYESMLAAA